MTEQTTDTKPEVAPESGIGYAVAGVLVVIALGAATRFLETQVPQWADGTAFEESPSRSNSRSTQSLWD